MSGQDRTAAQGHWLAVEFELRRVLDDEEAVDAALALKEAGFTVTAPEHLRSAALVREGQLDALPPERVECRKEAGMLTAYAGWWFAPLPNTAYRTTWVPGWNPNPWVWR